MIKSLSEGVSGLNANAKAMGVIGDNIANVKTIAYKSNSISFANLLSQTIEASRAGDGVQVWDISTLWSQGMPENTGNPTDLAINGSSFFMVRDSMADTIYYTRAGQFTLDKEGYLANPNGLIVQGRVVTDPELGILGNVQDIQISLENSAPLATDTIAFTTNLDADAKAGAIYRTSMTVYDSLGSPVVLNFEFTPSLDGTGSKIPGEWNWNVSVDSSVTDTPVASSGTIVFDGTGKLDPANTTPPNAFPAIDITNLKNGADDMSINWVYLTQSAGGAESDNSITGYASESNTIRQTQNGYPAGSLQRITIDEEGMVSGIYTNGEITPLYRITLADFANYQGLTGEGDNLYKESVESGAPLVGEAGSGSLGTISSGSLEMSNVDLSSEFVNLITTQRAFQANSKVITTSDEILSELMNLKR
ncbi:MAG: flagellar hook protein FlgE [Desulfococcaceae bacterium]|jgi:flagellar hook protein FlgE|nr:flagellar hook protein FlgE [Desulfococcaceae bacterium]